MTTGSNIPVDSEKLSDWKTVRDLFANLRFIGGPSASDADSATQFAETPEYYPDPPPSDLIRPSRAVRVEQLNDCLRIDYFAALEAVRFRDQLAATIDPFTIYYLNNRFKGFSQLGLRGSRARFCLSFMMFFGIAESAVALLLPDATFSLNPDIGAFGQGTQFIIQRRVGETWVACLSIEILTNRAFTKYMPSLVAAGVSPEGLPLCEEEDGRDALALGMGVSIGASNSSTRLGLWTDLVEFAVAHQYEMPDRQAQLVFGKPSLLSSKPLSLLQFLIYAMITSDQPADHSYSRPPADLTPSVGGIPPGPAPVIGDEGVGEPGDERLIDLNKCPSIEISYDLPLAARTSRILSRRTPSLQPSPPISTEASPDSLPAGRTSSAFRSTSLRTPLPPSIVFTDGPENGPVDTVFRGAVSGRTVVIKFAKRGLASGIVREAWIHQNHLRTLDCVPVCYGLFGNDHRTAILLEDSGPSLESFVDLSTSERRYLIDSLLQIHQSGVLHGDVCPSNITRTKDNRLVFVNFYSASILDVGERDGSFSYELEKRRRKLGLDINTEE